MFTHGSRGAVVVALAASASLSVAAFSTGDSAVIVNSGSTNMAGYRIVVERSGHAVCSLVRRRTTTMRRASNPAIRCPVAGVRPWPMQAQIRPMPVRNASMLGSPDYRPETWGSEMFLFSSGL